MSEDFLIGEPVKLLTEQLFRKRGERPRIVVTRDPCKVVRLRRNGDYMLETIWAPGFTGWVAPGDIATEDRAWAL